MNVGQDENEEINDTDEYNETHNDIILADDTEEGEFLPTMSIMGIFNIYYNSKYNTKGNLFSGTNPFNKHSINNKMVEFMKEIKAYKLMKNPQVTKNKHTFNLLENIYQLDIVDDNKMYAIKESNAEYEEQEEQEELDEQEELEEQYITFYSTSIIALMLKLSEFDWVNMKWTFT